MSESVRVIVRCRPINEREKGLKCKTVVRIDSECQCYLTNPNDGSAPPKIFSFDGVYGIESKTDSIYVESTYPLVESFLEGYNATVFAYGQTGCGKSFTMGGIQHSAFEHIFEAIESSDNIKYLVHASYLEIYNEEVRDLLAKDTRHRLELKEHPEKGVYVSGLSYHPVHSIEECEAILERGFKSRATGSTLMNADSSRSHSIFTVEIEMMDGSQRIRKGKLNLVDLAGSERQSKTGSTGDRLKEATKINLSLSALGNVISALVDGKSKHIPYRDSKLTRLLQDSLGGNTKTAMIACISPADNNYDETLSTLRYANRAKNIKNKPKINQDPKDALLNEYQQEILALREMLERHQNGGESGGAFSSSSGSDSGAEEEKERIRQEYEHQLEELRQHYEAEKQDRARLQADVESIKEQYQRELQERELSDSGNSSGQSLSPEQQEALARLQEIEENMVGGERAHDTALKEKLQKNKKAAEKRSKLAAEAMLNRSDDDDALLLRAYDNIQEELRVKTEALKKSKQKVRSLEREISDLYSEFQADRADYLETIRRQDQQIKLFQAILDKIQPTIRRDCNYANLDGIKAEAIWSDENQRWKLPDLVLIKTTLPPAGNLNNGNNRASSKANSPRISSDENEDDIDDFTNSNLIKKFEANEDVLQNYFKQKKTSDLLIRAQQDANRVLKKWSDLSSTKNGGLGNGNSVINWNNHFNTALCNLKNANSSAPNPPGKKGSPNQQHTLTPSPNSKDIKSPEITLIRRPMRLEALPLSNPLPKKLKPLHNSNTSNGHRG